MAMGSPRGLPDLGQPIDLGQAHEIDHGAGLLKASGPDVSQVATSKRQPDITPGMLENDCITCCWSV